jgi:hypothetical protein
MDPRLFTDSKYFADPTKAALALEACARCPVQAWCTEMMSGYTDGDVITAGVIFRYGKRTSLLQLQKAWLLEQRRARRRRRRLG